MTTVQQPDTKPGPYYVSAIDAGQTFLMAGPYSDHASALADVDRARSIAVEHATKAWWMAWGTVRIEGCTRAGSLNKNNLI